MEAFHLVVPVGGQPITALGGLNYSGASGWRYSTVPQSCDTNSRIVCLSIPTRHNAPQSLAINSIPHRTTRRTSFRTLATVIGQGSIHLLVSVPVPVPVPPHHPGNGTTHLAATHKGGRSWLTCHLSHRHVPSFARPELLVPLSSYHLLCQ